MYHQDINQTILLAQNRTLAVGSETATFGSYKLFSLFTMTALLGCLYLLEKYTDSVLMIKGYCC